MLLSRQLLSRRTGLLKPFAERAPGSQGAHTARLGDLTRKAFSSNAMPPVAPSETMEEKALRWLDVTGVLSRWYDRRSYILYLDPRDRVQAIMMTEWERRWTLFTTFGVSVMAIITLYYGYMQILHTHVAPLRPQKTNGIKKLTQYLDNPRITNTDFYWRNPLLKAKCSHCRWSELECQKQCFDELRYLGAGNAIDIEGLSLARTDAWPYE